MTPNRNVIESELVPPLIEHRLVEAQDSIFCDTGRRRGEGSQPIVDENSRSLFDPRQQMPQCECITFARRPEHDR